jgi:tellurite resistance protein
MTVKEITLLTIYKMASADGKIGGGANRIKDILGLSDEELNQKLENLVDEYSKLSKETKEAILAVAEFIMKADGKIDPNEKEFFNKMASLI